MLNRQSCIKCIVSHNPYCKWNHEDDEWWEKGKVFCQATAEFIKIISKPPQDCSMKLEHTVVTQKDM